MREVPLKGPVFQHGFLPNTASLGCDGFTSLCSRLLLPNRRRSVRMLWCVSEKATDAVPWQPRFAANFARPLPLLVATACRAREFLVVDLLDSLRYARMLPRALIFDLRGRCVARRLLPLPLHIELPVHPSANCVMISRVHACQDSIAALSQ